MSCGTAVDERVIDGTVNGIARGAEEFGERVRHLNSGNTRTYATWVVLGAVLLTIVLVWMARLTCHPLTCLRS